MLTLRQPLTQCRTRRSGDRVITQRVTRSVDDRVPSRHGLTRFQTATRGHPR